MALKQTCPRRVEGLQYDVENADLWIKKSKGFRTCSYCGSLHPDDFMRSVLEGVVLEVTDKDYKVYLYVFGHSKFYFQHLPAEQKREFVELYNNRPVRTYNNDDLSFTSEEGTGMIIGFPGYFHPMPYFMHVAKPSS